MKKTESGTRISTDSHGLPLSTLRGSVTIRVQNFVSFDEADGTWRHHIRYRRYPDVTLSGPFVTHGRPSATIRLGAGRSFPTLPDMVTLENPESQSSAPADAIPFFIRQERDDGSGCERETIRRARLGDDAAWERLVQLHAGWVLRSCMRWVHSRSKAEDLTQDVFIRVFHSLHSFRDERGGFRAWLSRITRNVVIDDHRRESRDRCRGLSSGEERRIHDGAWSAASHRCTPESSMEREERRVALLRALSALSLELKEAVLLRDIQGLSYEEIARLQNTPLGTVKSRVNRGRIELARLVRQRMTLLPGVPNRQPMTDSFQWRTA